MTKFSESIVDKIKCESIKPTPRWHFVLKSYVFWTLFFVSVTLGSFSFSVIVHFLESGDLNILDHLQGNIFTSVVMLLPFFWMIALILFAAIAYLNWKYTRRGYCIRRRWILLASMAISITSGSLFYILGFGRFVDNSMTSISPVYDKFKHMARRELWMQPEKGLLIGKIVSVNEEDELLVIRDEDGKNWLVSDSDVSWEDEQLEEKGKIIKIVGERIGSFEFAARDIRRCNNCQDDEFVEEFTLSDLEKNLNCSK